jgi:hypothetical protein
MYQFISSSTNQLMYLLLTGVNSLLSSVLKKFVMWFKQKADIKMQKTPY